MHVRHCYVSTMRQPSYNIHVLDNIQHEYYSMLDHLKMLKMLFDHQAEETNYIAVSSYC